MESDILLVSAHSQISLLAASIPSYYTLTCPKASPSIPFAANNLRCISYKKADLAILRLTI